MSLHLTNIIDLANVIAATVFTLAMAAVILYLPWSLRRTYRQTFIALARAVEAREPHMLGHAEQTARFVVWMARLRGMGFGATLRLEYAALLHGIGKVSVPYGLLNNPACLTHPLDRFVLRDYVRVGAAILDAIPLLCAAAETVRCQHEYIDGSGYPFGRYGKAIPLEAQMLCIASEYVAMTTPRLYRTTLPLTPAQADGYLREQRSRRYAPMIVTLFFLARGSERLQATLAGFFRRAASHLQAVPPPRRVL